MNKHHNHKSTSFAGILTFSRKKQKHINNSILFKAMFHHPSFYGESPNNKTIKEPQSKVSNFKNKLMTCLYQNKTPSKIDTKCTQSLGSSEQSPWSLKKDHKTSTVYESIELLKKQKECKKRSMKQYMAEMSIQKRKKYSLKTQPHSVELTPRKKTENKSHSMLVIRKINNRINKLFHEDNLNQNISKQVIKIPIHHTQTYYFRNKLIKNGKRLDLLSKEEKAQIFVTDIDEMRQDANNYDFIVKTPDMRKFPILDNDSDSEQIHHFSHQKSHQMLNFTKRRKNLCNKFGINLNSSIVKGKNEEEEFNIGPWQRRKTFDSQLNP